MEYCNSKLPNDILESIFCKLPTTSLLQCRCVCKSWRDILCNPDFAKLQLQPGSQLILVMEWKRIHWVEFQGRSDHYIHETTEVTFDSKLELVNSCNGLLCVHQYFETSNQEVLHILNPVTGEYFSLPPYKQTICELKLRSRFGANGCGLGFSSRTKQFKVIRLHFTIDSDEIHAEVLTIGSDKWRSIGKVLIYRFDAHSRQCFNWCSFDTFVNGSFHWLNNINFYCKICVFDFEEEKFGAFSLPYPMYRYWNKNIGVYENTIYSCGLLNGNLAGCESCELWLMKEYGVEESWIKTLVIESKKFNREKPWRLTYLLPSKNLMMLENGDILLFFDDETWLYNPREESFRSVLKTEFWNCQQILHKACFGSLKDIVAAEGLKILNVKNMVI